jgi:hypothetical protein
MCVHLHNKCVYVKFRKNIFVVCVKRQKYLVKNLILALDFVFFYIG